MSNIVKSKYTTVVLSQEQIEVLFQKINTGRRYYVDPNSPNFMHEITDLYFESLGLDFWTKPEVEELSFTSKTGELEFKFLTIND